MKKITTRGGRLTPLLGLLAPFVLLPSAWGAPMVSLDVLDDDVVVGESFGVEVWIDGDGIGEELLAFGFDVDTAGTYFSYDGYALGAGFDDDSFGPDNVAGSAFPGIADDDILLATLSFTALSAGTDSLAVSGPFDGLFSGAFYELSGFDIDAATMLSVSAGTAPVPEPATLFMVGGGLLGGACIRRRRSVR